MVTFQYDPNYAPLLKAWMNSTVSGGNAKTYYYTPDAIDDDTEDFAPSWVKETRYH